jgi:signal transduction histidine kinase
MLEPFAQEEEGYERNYEGAGLGLTIAYKLTQMMGGKFEIQSGKNKGTNIMLSFPILHKNDIN